ncbi:MAG: nitroreductase family deazaflavin-dependent oxidoreductase [Actinobacteria bacterium]|nr:nitroreductase family deazaflavin-dependent oxidoreductase [Actinomycetota bacterium]
MQKLFSTIHALWYRVLGGRLVGRIGKAPILLLTTTGRKTGKLRQLPLIYQPHGDDLVVVASNAGRPHHPAWYRNLQDDPHVSIRVGGDERPMVARTATDEERASLWPRMAAVYKGYDKYVQKTDRHIPVVILSPT